MIFIKLSHTAVGGLKSGYSYYERKEAGLGDYFKNTLLAEIEGLRVTAGIHRMMHGHHRMISRVFPYAIYYKFSDDTAKCGRSSTAAGIRIGSKANSKASLFLRFRV